MTETKFLLIRFAPGAAGKMLIACLGTHPEIASWNNTPSTNLEWVKKCYPGDFDSWLDTEPQNPWGLQKYVSAEYERGDKLEHLEIDFPDKWIPIIWHKNYLPAFIKQHHAINIIIDQTSVRWYHKSRWKKQFSVERLDDVYQITQHQHRPNYVVGNFNNQHIVHSTNLYSFIKDNVINYSLKKRFLKAEEQMPGSTILLSDLLCEDGIKNSLGKISLDMGLTTNDWSEAIAIWKYWRSKHAY